MNTLSPIRGVIFDMDGLMLDSERVYQITMQSAGREMGYTIAPEVFIKTIGVRSVDSRRIWGEVIGDHNVDTFYETWRRHAVIHIEANPIQRKPGLTELLAFLRDRNIPRTVATSTRRASATVRLQIAGLASEFPHIVCGDEIPHGKPAPDIFLAAAKLLNLPPSSCLVLEDSEPGIRGAKAAGCVTIMVPDLLQPSEEVRALANYVYPSLHDVLAHIQVSIS
jgi:HAD superfamily hydrolase (TIGR01509 family)